MSDTPKPEAKTHSIQPRRHHSASMPIRSRSFLPAVITSDNLPVLARSNLPARRRKSDVVKVISPAE